MRRRTGSSVEPIESNPVVDSSVAEGDHSPDEQKQPHSQKLGNQGRDDLLKDKNRLKQPLKQLSFRTDDNTHRKIEQAAEKANKSINAWMEEILTEAANDALGVVQKTDSFHSRSIQNLIDDEELAAELAEQLEDYLQEWNMRTVFRFNAALQRLLIGLDEIHIFQRAGAVTPTDEVSTAWDKTATLTNLAASLLPFLPEDDNSAAIIRLASALKKLIQGIASVKPFLKENKDENTRNVVSKIENYLHDPRNTDE